MPMNMSKGYPARRIWKMISLDIKIRDQFKCMECGLSFFFEITPGRNRSNIKIHPAYDENEILQYLTVHHIDRNPKNCDPRNLISLCGACHLREDNRLRKEEKFDQLEEQGQQNFFQRSDYVLGYDLSSKDQSCITIITYINCKAKFKLKYLQRRN